MKISLPDQFILNSQQERAYFMKRTLSPHFGGGETEHDEFETFKACLCVLFSPGQKIYKAYDVKDVLYGPMIIIIRKTRHVSDE